MLVFENATSASFLSGSPATYVLGQSSFFNNSANVAPNKLSGPDDVMPVTGGILVVDTANTRVVPLPSPPPPVALKTNH